MRTKLVLILVGVLIGATPVAYQYWQLDQEFFAAEERFENQVDAAVNEAAGLRQRLELTRLRSQASAIVFEVQDQNFGRARELATDFFGDLQDLIATTEHPSLRGRLEDILKRRDELIADLAALRPQSAAKFREIYSTLAESPAPEMPPGA